MEIIRFVAASHVRVAGGQRTARSAGGDGGRAVESGGRSDHRRSRLAHPGTGPDRAMTGFADGWFALRTEYLQVCALPL